MSVQAQFPLELDHVYIMVAKDAPEVVLLQSLGLFFLDEVAVHEGQGTASRFVLFKNMYLELAWVSDRETLVQESARVGSDFAVPENWRELGASPFGVGLHYKSTSSRSLPVVTKRHEAQWMPSGTWIDLIPKASIYEPEYFVLSDGLAYTKALDSETTHPLGLQYLTQLCITVTNRDQLGPMTTLLAESGILKIQEGSFPLMELTFDEGAREVSFDCRPTLPLIVKY